MRGKEGAKEEEEEEEERIVRSLNKEKNRIRETMNKEGKHSASHRIRRPFRREGDEDNQSSEREREKRTRETVDYNRSAEGQGRTGGGKERSTSQIWLAVSSCLPLRRAYPFRFLSLSLAYELHGCGKRELWSKVLGGKGRIPLEKGGRIASRNVQGKRKG